MRRVGDPIERGRRLLAARKRAGLGQKELAKAAGISHMTVLRIENAKQEGVNYDTLQRLARVLGVQVSDLEPEAEGLAGPLIDEYLTSGIGQYDKPTDEEITWLRTQAAAFWDGMKPSVGALHEMIEFRRKHSV